ncbi:MAG: radical SAM protein, partial [Phycisphaerae bacterium SM23_33]
VEEICDLLIQRGHDLNLWAYARVDTVTAPLLAKLKRAGFNWLAYGFESASPKVRESAGKRFDDGAAERAIELTRRAGIYIIANFIFGLPGDDRQTMQATLAFAKRHNFQFVNFYSAMAYPGSRLYEQAVAEGRPLPESWHGYSQFGAEALPLPTRDLSAAEVLRFRDEAFVDYFSDPDYQQKIRATFGPDALEHVREMLSYNMVRKHAPVETA